MRSLKVVHEILDNQICDSNDCKLGRVDGIVILLGDGQPRLTYLEVGATVLARRIGPRWERFIGWLLRKFGPRDAEPYRIPFEQIESIGLNVNVDLDGERSGAYKWERWLRQHVAAKLPGGKE